MGYNSPQSDSNQHIVPNRASSGYKYKRDKLQNDGYIYAKFNTTKSQELNYKASKI